MASQSRALELISKKKLSNDQRLQLVNLLRITGLNIPDVMLENAYQSYKHNPNSEQKYIQLEQIIYSGLQLKLDINTMKKFAGHLRKKLGDNTYIRRIIRFIQYTKNDQIDPSPLQDLLRDDFSDNETLKKSITSFKRQRKVDEYIQKINKYLSVQPLDEQAWTELAQIYTEKGHYMKAAFCYEELIVISPANDVYVLKLSQLYLTLGNKSTTDKAIKYLTYLITKRPQNLRALWILYRAVVGLEQYQQLKETTYQVINKLYSKKNAALKFHLAF